MDLVKARKKAKKKAGKKKKKKAASKTTVSRKKTSKKAISKKKSFEKVASQESAPTEEEVQAPEEASGNFEHSSAAKKADDGPDVSRDDVFTDDAFGEDLPFVPTGESDGSDFILDGVDDDIGLGGLPAEDDSSLDFGAAMQEAEPVREDSGAGKSSSGPAPRVAHAPLPVRDQAVEPASNDSPVGKKPVGENIFEVSERKHSPRIKADWEMDDSETVGFDGIIADDDDFLHLVTEDLYMREFGESDEDLSELMELLSFRLAEEVYAVRLTSIRQLIRMMPVTMVPRAPDYVLGIISLRGNIIPVFDLRRRLKLAASEPTRRSRIIVVSEGKFTVGLIVDEIEQVVRIAESGIEPPPPILAGIESEFIEGIGRTQEKMIILLDLEKLLVPVIAGKTTKAG